MKSVKSPGDNKREENGEGNSSRVVREGENEGGGG